MRSYVSSATLLVTTLLFTCTSRSAADELLFPNADFETGTLEGWTAEGAAFTVQPTKGDNPQARNRESSQHQGDYWIGTFERYNGREGKPGATRGDAPTGTLTSPTFTVKKKYITFRVGGGYRPGETGVRLLCEGQEIVLSSGVDSESMELISSDVSQFIGKPARLVIFDAADGGWGHINVDAFMAADKAAPNTGADFALTGDISAAAYPDTGYDQPLRPQFHFSSRMNWLNDPNGMLHDGQQYHLFFQHNPLGTAWGNMTWGHATSTDMVRWRQQDHALLPYRVDRRQGTIFSGTAIVDHNNSLGVQVGETKTLVAFYTFANNRPHFYQAMAYSTDRGQTWTYYNEGRAVVPNQGLDHGERDPKVFWHAPSGRWVMALWVQRNPGLVRFFTSRDLRTWEFASDLQRDWAYECMDLVFLPIDGDANRTKCVLYDASFDYEIGAFDGTTFHSESQPLRAGGGNFYAAQTFNNSPDGRCVQIGWMRGGPNSAQEYGLPFNQQMAFPCELTLRTTPDGVRLRCWPIAEIETLVRRRHLRENVQLAGDKDLLAGIDKLDLVDLSVDFAPGTAEQLVIDLPGITLTYDTASGKLLHSGRNKEGLVTKLVTLDQLHPRDGTVQLRLLIDRLSVEGFGFGGEVMRAHYYNPRHGTATQSIRAIGGTATVKRLEIRELESAWE